VQEINLGAHKRATFALSQLAQSLSWGVVGDRATSPCGTDRGPHAA